MKRTVVTLALAALVLGGCSGKTESQEATKPAAAAAKKGGKDKAHVNPWASDAPADTAAAAPAPAKDAKKVAGKEQPKANPWAKDPPPGAPSSEPAKDAKK